MSLLNSITRRNAVVIVVCVALVLIFTLTLQNGYPQTVKDVLEFAAGRDIKRTTPNVTSAGPLRPRPQAPPQAPPQDPPPALPLASPPSIKAFHYGNGRIAYGNSIHSLTPEELGKMTPAALELYYEKVVLETTADCSTARRFGRKEDGGWDVCFVGPFFPHKPCFIFSFGVNNVWEFDDEVASTFGCQVLAFDPSMAQASHMRNDKVAFLKEGLHSAKGMINNNAWPVDSYLGYLKRFGAENYVIDILKMDIEGSEWGALETAVLDGSLKNVKQLMLETHIGQVLSVKEYQRHFALIKALHDLGFRQWHHNWNTYGNFNSQLNPSQVRSCCHELYYINVNFLGGTRPDKNPGNTPNLKPLAG